MFGSFQFGEPQFSDADTPLVYVLLTAPGSYEITGLGLIAIGSSRLQIVPFENRSAIVPFERRTGIVSKELI